MTSNAIKSALQVHCQSSRTDGLAERTLAKGFGQPHATAERATQGYCPKKSLSLPQTEKLRERRTPARHLPYTNSATVTRAISMPSATAFWCPITTGLSGVLLPPSSVGLNLLKPQGWQRERQRGFRTTSGGLNVLTFTDNAIALLAKNREILNHWRCCSLFLLPC